MCAAVWNPVKYMAGAFGNSRIRAALDLLNRTSEAALAANLDVKKVLDLGCGPGNMTRHLKSRFPNAHIHGIDSSAAMINTAKNAHAGCAGITFGLGGIEEVSKDITGGQFDVIYSNAALHWVLNHDKLLPDILNNRLNKNGLFAFQMPDTRTQPSHLLMEEALKRIGMHEEMFVDLKPVPIRIPRVEQDPIRYAQIFYDMNRTNASTGSLVDMDHWVTEYVHHLPIAKVNHGTNQSSSKWPDEHPVCGWTSSSGLLPIAEYLGKESTDSVKKQKYESFMRVYNELLYEQYPPLENHLSDSDSDGSFYVMLGYKRYFCIVSQQRHQQQA